MKKLKKYISVIAAVVIAGAYAAMPAYALNPNDDPSDTQTVNDAGTDDEDAETIIPIEEEDDEEEDEEDIEFIGQTPVTEATTESTVNQVEEDVAMIEPAETAATTASTAAAAPTDIPTYNEVSAYTVYASEVVNVRYGPDTSYSKMGTIYANSPVTVIGYSGGWYAIQYNGTTGFVSSGFFADNPPETTSSSAAAPVDQNDQADNAEQTTQESMAAEIVDDFPSEVTDSPVDDDEIAVTTANEKDADTTKAAVQTEEETDDEKPAAAGTTDNSNSGGLGSIIIALGCAVGTFLIVGVIPVIIHRIYHNKLYQY